MRVAITGVEKVNDEQDMFLVSFGDQTYDCPIFSGQARGLEVFRFESPFIEAAFHFDGIGAMFTRDYWKYRHGQGRPFPWDYGQHDEQIIAKAQTLVEKIMNTD